ncbi:MAG TPA: peptide MFS transporter [Candidatus Acidoferrales bacterium]|nr:peptide MFS transporter [Candidatus Acidoferrales bacterium]
MSDTTAGRLNSEPGVPLAPLDTIRKHRTFFGHPLGLFFLFFTEMWERFSYYGMRALLVLYMVDHLIKGAQSGTSHVLGFATLQHGLEAVFGPLAIQPLASQIYGLYTAFVYFTPIFGGMLADRVLGQRKTVIVGAILMAIGHFLMAAESMFLVALCVLILGNGCFKPNLATQIGSLYPPGDPRRDRAYSIYYMGVNLGGFLSPLVCGTLGQVYGWHYGFGAAGVGMVTGLVLYLAGQRYLPADQLTRARLSSAEKVKAPLTPAEWKAIIGLIVLCALTMVFWGVFEQQGNTLQIFADRNINWHVFGRQLPSTWFQSADPLFIFLLTPFLNMFWSWQSSRRKEPGSVTKMAAGCALLGVAFLPLIFISSGLRAEQRVNLLWLLACAFVYTVGELYLSPVGLSLVSKVAPARLVGMLMGMWFLANFFGNYLAGYLGTFYEKMSREAFFSVLLVLGVAAGAAILALSAPLRRAVGHDV